jgi:hypothetical protein
MDLRFGTWNVGSLFREIAARELARYKYVDLM